MVMVSSVDCALWRPPSQLWARTCDLIMIVLDAGKPVTHKFLIERELHNFGIRLNEEPPRVTIRKKDNGGVEFQWLCPQTQGMNSEVATRMAAAGDERSHHGRSAPTSPARNISSTASAIQTLNRAPKRSGPASANTTTTATKTTS